MVRWAPRTTATWIWMTWMTRTTTTRRRRALARRTRPRPRCPGLRHPQQAKSRRPPSATRTSRGSRSRTPPASRQPSGPAASPTSRFSSASFHSRREQSWSWFSRVVPETSSRQLNTFCQHRTRCWRSSSSWGSEASRAPLQLPPAGEAAGPRPTTASTRTSLLFPISANHREASTATPRLHWAVASSLHSLHSPLQTIPAAWGVCTRRSRRAQAHFPRTRCWDDTWHCRAALQPRPPRTIRSRRRRTRSPPVSATRASTRSIPPHCRQASAPLFSWAPTARSASICRPVTDTRWRRNPATNPPSRTRNRLQTAGPTVPTVNTKIPNEPNCVPSSF